MPTPVAAVRRPLAGFLVACLALSIPGLEPGRLFAEAVGTPAAAGAPAPAAASGVWLPYLELLRADPPPFLGLLGVSLDDADRRQALAELLDETELRPQSLEGQSSEAAAAAVAQAAQARADGILRGADEALEHSIDGALPDGLRRRIASLQSLPAAVVGSRQRERAEAMLARHVRTRVEREVLGWSPQFREAFASRLPDFSDRIIMEPSYLAARLAPATARFESKKSQVPEVVAVSKPAPAAPSTQEALAGVLSLLESRAPDQAALAQLDLLLPAARAANDAHRAALAQLRSANDARREDLPRRFFKPSERIYYQELALTAASLGGIVAMAALPHWWAALGGGVLLEAIGIAHGIAEHSRPPYNSNRAWHLVALLALAVVVGLLAPWSFWGALAAGLLLYASALFLIYDIYDDPAKLRQALLPSPRVVVNEFRLAVMRLNAFGAGRHAAAKLIRDLDYGAVEQAYGDWRKALLSPYPEVSALAVEALRARGAYWGPKEAEAALRDPRAFVRANALDALAWQHYVLPDQELLIALLVDADARVRTAAVAALKAQARFKLPPEASARIAAALANARVDPLIEASILVSSSRGDSKPRRWTARQVALLLLFASRAEPTLQPEALRLLALDNSLPWPAQRYLFLRAKSDAPYSVRAEILAGLVGQKAVAGLILKELLYTAGASLPSSPALTSLAWRGLADENPATSNAALSILQNLPSQLSHLTHRPAAFSAPAAHARRNAITLASAFPLNDVGLGILAERLQDPEPELRRLAANALLAQDKRVDAPEALEAAVGDPDPEVRLTAASLLASARDSVPPPQLLEEALRLLDEPGVKRTADAALRRAKILPDAVVDGLGARLDSPDPAIRRQAAQILRATPKPSERQLMAAARAVGSGDSDVRSNVFEILRQAGSPLPKPVLDALVDRMGSPEGGDTAAAILLRQKELPEAVIGAIVAKAMGEGEEGDVVAGRLGGDLLRRFRERAVADYRLDPRAPKSLATLRRLERRSTAVEMLKALIEEPALLAALTELLPDEGSMSGQGTLDALSAGPEKLLARLRKARQIVGEDIFESRLREVRSLGEIDLKDLEQVKPFRSPLSDQEPKAWIDEPGRLFELPGWEIPGGVLIDGQTDSGKAVYLTSYFFEKAKIPVPPEAKPVNLWTYRYAFPGVRAPLDPARGSGRDHLIAADSADLKRRLRAVKGSGVNPVFSAVNGSFVSSDFRRNGLQAAGEVPGQEHGGGVEEYIVGRNLADAGVPTLPQDDLTLLPPALQAKSINAGQPYNLAVQVERELSDAREAAYGRWPAREQRVKLAAAVLFWNIGHGAVNEENLTGDGRIADVGHVTFGYPLTSGLYHCTVCRGDHGNIERGILPFYFDESSRHRQTLWGDDFSPQDAESLAAGLLELAVSREPGSVSLSADEVAAFRDAASDELRLQQVSTKQLIDAQTRLLRVDAKAFDRGHFFPWHSSVSLRALMQVAALKTLLGPEACGRAKEHVLSLLAGGSSRGEGGRPKALSLLDLFERLFSETGATPEELKRSLFREYLPTSEIEHAVYTRLEQAAGTRRDASEDVVAASFAQEAEALRDVVRQYRKPVEVDPREFLEALLSLKSGK